MRVSPLKSRFCRQTFVKVPPNTDYLPECTYEVRDDILRLWLPEQALEEEIKVGEQLLYSPDEPDILTDPEISFCPRATPLSDLVTNNGWVSDSLIIWTEDGTVIDILPKPACFNLLSTIFMIIFHYTDEHLKPPRFSDILGVLINKYSGEYEVIRNTLIPLNLAVLSAAGAITIIPF